MSEQDYAALATKEAKHEAIAEAESIEALDAMWATWEQVGWSREGLMYAAVLARKAELGHELTDTEADTLKRAAARQKKGAAKKPISGRRT